MIRFRATVSLCLGLSTALAAMCGSVLPAAAAQGDKAGWQFRIEGEGDSERQFLIYAARDNGARIARESTGRTSATPSLDVPIFP